MNPHFGTNSSSGVMAKNVNFEKSAKNGKNGGLLCFFSNPEQSFILIFFFKLETRIGLIWVKNACSGGIWFLINGLKRYQPIRLQGS